MVRMLRAGTHARPLAGEERALIARARTGDREALRALLVPHEALLFRVCLAQLAHAADAEDAAQETLLLAIQALTRPRGFREECALSTYLVKIALRVCGRRGRRREMVALDTRHAESLGGDPTPAVLDRLVLEQALRRLTAEQRAALLLQSVEGWSVRGIAASLGISEKKVDNTLYRARQALARWERETTYGEGMDGRHRASTDTR
jgi:RNA polymerase sigma-70 factor (ECF subfamily)